MGEPAVSARHVVRVVRTPGPTRREPGPRRSESPARIAGSEQRQVRGEVGPVAAGAPRAPAACAVGEIQPSGGQPDPGHRVGLDHVRRRAAGVPRPGDRLHRHERRDAHLDRPAGGAARPGSRPACRMAAASAARGRSAPGRGRAATRVRSSECTTSFDEPGGEPVGDGDRARGRRGPPSSAPAGAAWPGRRTAAARRSSTASAVRSAAVRRGARRRSARRPGPVARDVVGQRRRGRSVDGVASAAAQPAVADQRDAPASVPHVPAGQHRRAPGEVARRRPSRVEPDQHACGRRCQRIAADTGALGAPVTGCRSREQRGSVAVQAAAQLAQRHAELALHLEVGGRARRPRRCGRTAGRGRCTCR